MAQRVRPGPSGDLPDLVALAAAAHAVLPCKPLATAGNDGEAHRRFGRKDLSVQRPIPAKKRRPRRVIVATTPSRQETQGRLGEPGDEASRKTYRRRRNAATVRSAVKRR